MARTDAPGRKGRAAGIAAAHSLGAALLLGAAAAAAAQEAGDRVEILLRSGKTYTGTLVASSSRAVTIRLGRSEVELPRTMVADLRKLEEPPPVEPAPAASPRPGEGAAPSSGNPAAGGETAKSPLPRPTSILLRDGSLVEGYVLSKDEKTLWILPGKAREISLDRVEEIFGDAEALGGGGLRITGDAARDTDRLVRELGSTDLTRATAAAAALETYGDEAVPALIRGLRSGDAKTQIICVGILIARRPDGAVDPLLDLLKNDGDAPVRAEAAKALLYYDSPAVRRALLESVWRDPSDDVKYAASLPLKKIATVEEVSALLDLLSIIPPRSNALPPLYDALRRATGKGLGDDAKIWSDWWETGGGREEISEKVQEVISKRMMELSRPR